MQLCSAAYSQVAPSVTLEWNASPDPTVVGYYVYYGSAPGVFTHKSNAGTNTVFLVPGLATGSAFYFTATCVDKAGRESAFAPEISYAVPSPAISNNPVASPITYGHALTASVVKGTVTNFGRVVVPGAFAFASAAVLAVGTYTEPVIFTPLDTNHFNSVRGTANVTIQPASLTITARNASKTYGQTLTFAGTEFSTAGLVNGDIVAKVTLSCTGATNAAGAGNYGIVLGSLWTGSAKPANYSVKYVNGTLTVNRASIIVTANNRNRAYGAAIPPLTATHTGFANKDTASVLSGAPVLSVKVTSNSPVGSYPISVAIGTLTAANHGFFGIAGQLSVTPASLTIVAAEAVTKTYGQTVTFPGTEFDVYGLQNDDTV